MERGLEEGNGVDVDVDGDGDGDGAGGGGGADASVAEAEAQAPGGGGGGGPSLDSFFGRLGGAAGDRFWSRSTGWLSSQIQPSPQKQEQRQPVAEDALVGGDSRASSQAQGQEGEGQEPPQPPPPPPPPFHSVADGEVSTPESKRPMEGGKGEAEAEAVTAPTPPPTALKSAATKAAAMGYRETKLVQLLSLETVSLQELRKLSWNGVPLESRPMVWKLLLGYMPANRDRREGALARKRREYQDSMQQVYGAPSASRTTPEQVILRQILVDVPRTSPGVPLFHVDEMCKSMERVLFVWAIRHPATGYVQGINDLITPLYMVFLSEHMECLARFLEGMGSLDGEMVASQMVTGDRLQEVEADVYWCLTKLLDNIQDHYTAMQPGLQRMVLHLEDLVRRIDVELHSHLENEGLQFMQFAFRWMNCLLLRELPLRCVVRAWDTCLSEERGFETFHIYLCAAVLCKFSPNLKMMDFQELVLFLQDLPTSDWSEKDVEPLLSQAYILSTLFENSSAHLQRVDAHA